MPRRLKNLFALFALCLVFSLAPMPASAELPQYQPIVPIANITDKPGLTFAQYVSEVYMIFVSLGAILAVLMLVYGGLEYMTSDVVKAKAGGLSRIRGALIGLVLLLASYLVLYIINPCLVRITVFTDENSPCFPYERGTVEVPGGYTVDTETGRVQLTEGVTYDPGTGLFTSEQGRVTQRSDGYIRITNNSSILEAGPPGSTSCANPTRGCAGPNNTYQDLPEGGQCPSATPQRIDVCLTDL